MIIGCVLEIVCETLIIQARFINITHRSRDETNYFAMFINQPPDMRQANNRKLLDDIVGALNAHEYNNVRFTWHTIKMLKSHQIESTIY